jgi:hypothetical protein
MAQEQHQPSGKPLLGAGDAGGAGGAGDAGDAEGD